MRGAGLGIAVAIVLTCSGPADARDTARSGESRPARLELGGGMLGVFGPDADAAPIPGSIVRVNLTNHWAAQVVLSIDTVRPRHGFEGSYQIQAAYTGAARDRRIRPFATIGTAGFFAHGRPVAHLNGVHRPEGIIGGGGASVRVWKLLSVESGLQFWMMWSSDDAWAGVVWHTMMTIPTK